MKRVLSFTILLFLVLSLGINKIYPKTLAQDSSVYESPSPYGMNTSSGSPFWTTSDPEHFPKMAKLLAEAGVRWMRVWAIWFLIEPQNDQWDESHLQKVEALLQALQNEGIKVSLVLGKTPEWASSAPPGADSKNYPPLEIIEWHYFVQKLSNRFAGNLVQAWEIENEVSGKKGFVNKKGFYTRMVKRASILIKRDDPNAIILLSSFVPNKKKREIITYWLRETKPYVDVLNVHKYGSHDEVEQAIQRFKNYARNAGVGNKPIWLTETNVCKSGWGEWCQDPGYGAKELPTRYKIALEKGVKKVFWFHFTTRIWGPGILKGPEETESGQYEPLEPMYSAYRGMATGKETISLFSGWNQITWPDISGYTAKAALDGIDDNCGMGTAVVITKKTRDWWENYVINYGGKNFNLENKQDYFIKLTKDCNWTP